MIIFAAEEPAGINKFLQNNNYLYLTGLYETAEAIYVSSKSKDKIKEILFIQRNIPERIVWDGAKMYPEEAKEQSGLEDVKFLDEFEDTIFPYLAVAQKLYVNSGMVSLARPLNKALSFLAKVRDRFVQLVFAEANQLMTPIRQIKDETEIEYMTKAIEITGFGLESIFKNARSGMYEYELEAMLFYEMRRRGITHYGFAPIIAGGVNATILHYKQNNQPINNNELVLCDVGALYNNYSADITRTFPIEKTFSARQKEVYQAVLFVQKSIIAMIKPEVSMADLNKKTEELIGEACKNLGLIADVKDFKQYYYHSIGHHLGMDTHDLGARDAVLKEGMVITVEPGIYIAEEKIGVRIEDDVLVTKDSHKVLSSMIPKEIEDIERFRKDSGLDCHDFLKVSNSKK
jgi:Xaa-Pro aminopeptidase